jgi:murein DD-endopeptidase MepM/ murein hydrolase activator NlpD
MRLRGGVLRGIMSFQAPFFQESGKICRNIGKICYKMGIIVKTYLIRKIFRIGKACINAKMDLVSTISSIIDIICSVGKTYQICFAYHISKTHITIKTHLDSKICRIEKPRIIDREYLIGKICQLEENFRVYRTFLAYKQTIYRVAVASCLCAVVTLNFTLPMRQTSDSDRVKEQASAEAGVGGGDYREKAIPEGLVEAGNFELGMLEPESFSKPRTLLYNAYTVQKGDMIGGLAESFGLNQDTLISINNIKNTRLVQIGQVLRIPNQDGIIYTVKKDDTLETIAAKYKSSASDIQIANELFSDKALPGTSLFIPGAQLDWMEKQEINGDLFMWPVAGYITSNYGYRSYPFDDDGGRQFHSGLDIGASMGSPVRAAMSGRVSSAGWDDVLGNHVVISHHAGYRTLYGHMSVIRVKTGAYVGTGERIGDVGSTGRSTGPHCHFTVYKNGVTVNPRVLLK